MRTSLSQQTQSALMYLTSSGNRLAEVQERAVTGKRINKASDDVPGTNAAMSLRSSIKSLSQYGKNIQVSQPLLSTTMNATSELTKITRSVRDIAVAAANEDFTGKTRETYVTQLNNLMAQMVDVAKTKHNDTYIFSGTAASVCPFVENPNSDPQTGLPPYLYQGSGTQRSVKVLAWVSLPVNVAGNDMFNFSGAEGSDMFSMITKLKNAIQTNDSRAISSEINNIDKNYDNLLTWSARLGSWSSRMEAATNTLEDTKVRLKEMLSNTEDIDLTEAIVDLKTQENVYQTAISVTQRILQMSLASGN